jgi:tRNA G10  N-methylase Trm11
MASAGRTSSGRPSTLNWKTGGFGAMSMSSPGPADLRSSPRSGSDRDHHCVEDRAHTSPQLVELAIGTDNGHLTHRLFRYPAKFHPPVVRALLERFTKPGDLVLDPFVGSGTLLVEATVNGRSAIGVDVDPVAVAVSNAKTLRLRPDKLAATAATIRTAVQGHQRPAAEYRARMHDDLTERQYALQKKPVAEYIPLIPNLDHWFRRYVTVDLARIRRAIADADIPATHRPFIDVVFASIIRNSSNADPVPVSGLEVTSHMLKRDKEGRLVNPFALFDRALERAVKMSNAYYQKSQSDVVAAAVVGDATRVSEAVDRQIDAVITSPPYHGAVDYYRRHQLEMFWLGEVVDQTDRLELLGRYIGRPKVPQSHPFVSAGTVSTALAKEWEQKIRDADAKRANAFHHYIVAMSRCFEELASVLASGAPAVFVVGHSSWNSAEIPTTDLFAEISGDGFRLEELLSYPVKNRYMSYTRHNNADISTEYVLVLRRR